jgi:hypothetical protein
MFNCESNWQATFKTDAALVSNTYTSSTDATSSSSTDNSGTKTSSQTGATVSATSSAAAATGPGVASKSTSGSKAGLIAGATIGGIAAIALVGIAILLAMKYGGKNKKSTDSNASYEPKMLSAPGSSQPGSVEPYKDSMGYPHAPYGQNPYPNEQYGTPQYPAEVQGNVPYGHAQTELMGTPVAPGSAGPHEMPTSPKPK